MLKTVIYDKYLFHFNLITMKIFYIGVNPLNNAANVAPCLSYPVLN